MKALFLADSFKGTLKSEEVNQILEETFHKYHPTWILKSYSFADGGEGTLHALSRNLKERMIIRKDIVTGPYEGSKVEAEYGILDNQTILIESATIIGLPLLPKEKRNPLFTTSDGIGEMIQHRIQEGYHDFILSLGGSSTDDMGAGMLYALGAEFINHQGISYFPTGSNLLECNDVVLDRMQNTLKGTTFHVLADVDNPLLGEDGATYVFAPQKGAKKEDLPLLESGIRNLNQILIRKYQKDCSTMKGAGAAGGLGAASLYAFHATIQNGASYLLEQLHLEEELSDTDVLFTGEGKLDGSSFEGKAISSLCRMALSHHVPVYLVCGMMEESIRPLLPDYGIKDVIVVENNTDIPEDILKREAKNHLQKRWETYIREHGFPL